MTETQQAELVEAVTEMRYQQKRFFAARPGSGTRSAALHHAQIAERKVDHLLKQLKAPELYHD